MTRVEFMNELEYLLQDITDSEREEALQYYEGRITRMQSSGNLEVPRGWRRSLKAV